MPDFCLYFLDHRKLHGQVQPQAGGRCSSARFPGQENLQGCWFALKTRSRALETSVPSPSVTHSSRNRLSPSPLWGTAAASGKSVTLSCAGCRQQWQCRLRQIPMASCSPRSRLGGSHSQLLPQIKVGGVPKCLAELSDLSSCLKCCFSSCKWPSTSGR